MPTKLTEDYAKLLQSLKERIANAQVKAALAVNRELVLLYWHIGREILERQKAQGWGAKVIEQLSKDLRSAFPEMKGFSRANLLYMRNFAEAYPNEEFVQQLVGQIPWGHNARILEQFRNQCMAKTPAVSTACGRERVRRNYTRPLPQAVLTRISNLNLL